MGRPLFDKTYDELRKTFVRARFAEPAVFDLADIEEWMASRKVPYESSDDHTAWAARSYFRYLEVVWNEMVDRDTRVVPLLHSHVTPLSEPRAWFTRKLFHGVSFIRTVATLKAGGAEIYYPDFQDEDRVVIVVMHREVFALETADGDNWAKDATFASLRRATMWEVVELFLDEYVCNRPRAVEALAFLKDDYRIAIQREREAAQRDFDEAVAVSLDGTKIVKAKWVLVCGRTPEWRNKGYLLRGETFRAHKCRLRNGYSFKVDLEFLEDIRDFGVGFTTEDLFRGRVACYCGNPHIFDFYYLRESQQVFHGQLESLLVIDESFCPSPLPDGGREIRV